MKKILLFLFALFICSIAFAYDVKINGIYYNLNYENKTAEVTHGGNEYHSSYTQSEIFIPSSITHNGTTFKVISIGSNAFYNCETLTFVIIGDNVISIGSWAFADCKSLSVIKIPKSVQKIGSLAFSGCKLKHVFISDILNFCHYSNFNNFLDGAILYLNDEIVTDLIIPDEVIYIGHYAFYGCSSLKSVTIPRGVYIGSHAFSNCKCLEKVSIAFSYDYINKPQEERRTTHISDGAFSYCTALKTIIMGTSLGSNDVINIYDDVFWGCTALTSVMTSPEVKSIGDRAFAYCNNLEKIWININVEQIGNNAFYNCSSLRYVYSYSSTPPILGQDIFEGCNIRSIYVRSWNINLYRERWSEYYNKLAIE